MTTFLLTVALVAAAMAAMALGSYVLGRPLRGSCGGVGGNCACEDQGLDVGVDEQGRRVCAREAAERQE
jgi:hypothetical protein